MVQKLEGFQSVLGSVPVTITNSGTFNNGLKRRHQVQGGCGPAGSPMLDVGLVRNIDNKTINTVCWTVDGIKNCTVMDTVAVSAESVVVISTSSSKQESEAAEADNAWAVESSP